MTMSELHNYIEEVYHALPDMVEMAGCSEYDRVGDEVRGSHPLHGSTTGGNFRINPGKQVWFCEREGHKVGGGKFEWIYLEHFLNGDCSKLNDKNLKASLFPEVVRKASDIAGIPPKHEEMNREDIIQYKIERDGTFRVYEEAVKFYQNQLTDEHYHYIRTKWGFDKETADTFGFGYAPPDGTGLFSHLLNKLNVSDPRLLLMSGLFFKVESETEQKIVDHFRGRIVIPYFQDGQPRYFIGRDPSWTAGSKYGKYKKNLVHTKKHHYVSKLVRESVFGVDSLSGHDFVIITEGITDCISANAVGLPAISPVTTRFKGNDIDRIRQYTKGKQIYICMDNEESGAGLNGALSVLESLHDDSSLIILPKPPGVQKIDLNDYFKTHTKEEFLQLMEYAVPKFEALFRYGGSIPWIFAQALKELNIDPEEARAFYIQPMDGPGLWKYVSIYNLLKDTKTVLEGISIFRINTKSDSRCPSGVSAKNRVRVIARVILADMANRGSFLRDAECTPYYHFRKENVVFPLSKIEPILHDLYKVNGVDTEGKFILQEIENHARRHGKETSIFKYFHYNTALRELYVFDRVSHYYRIDGEAITKHANGENGVYFTSPPAVYGQAVKPIKYVQSHERRTEFDIYGEVVTPDDGTGLIDRVLINRVNFTEETALTGDQQRLQLKLHLYSIPFNKLLMCRPIMSFCGEKGSGKSEAARMIGKFFLGSQFNLTSLGEKEDLRIGAVNEPLLFIDNVDKTPNWLENDLATMATGTRFQKRELYTNFEMITRDPTCFLALTSRTPRYNRDDVVDRMLLFHLARFKEGEFLPPHALLAPLSEYQDELWSEYFDDLNMIIARLRSDPIEKKHTSYRLADWAILSEIIAESLRVPSGVTRTLLESMQTERAAFALQYDILLSVMKLWKASLDCGTWASTSELWEALNGLDKEKKFNYASPRSLGRRLSNIKSELKTLVGLDWKYDTHEKKWFWCIPWVRDDEEGGTEIEEDETPDKPNISGRKPKLKTKTKEEESEDDCNQEDTFELDLSPTSANSLSPLEPETVSEPTHTIQGINTNPEDYKKSRLAITQAEVNLLRKMHKMYDEKRSPISLSDILKISGYHEKHVQDIFRKSLEAERIEKDRSNSEPAFLVTNKGIHAIMKFEAEGKE